MKTTKNRIAIMPLARSDELIFLNSKWLILIAIDSNYLITIVIMEWCACMRQMVYTAKHIASRKSIQCIDKKFDSLAEQNHSNDIVMYNTYDTNDEITTVLTYNYALKTGLSEYIIKIELEKKKAKIESFKLKYLGAF